MAVFTVNYSLTPGFSTTVAGGAGGDDVLVLNWGAATLNQGLGMFVPDVAGDAAGGGQIGNHNYVTYSFMERFQVFTGAGNDFFTLGNLNDIASMGSGNDFVDTRAGEAQVDGGIGTDTWSTNWTGVVANIGVNLQTNTVTGVGGSSVTGIEAIGTQNSFFNTGSGNDVLTTLIGASAIYNDYIQTNGGNDTVVVGGGGDTVDLGAGGDDLLIVDYSWIANGIASSRTGSGLDWNGIFQPGAAGANAVIYSNVARFDIRGATGGDIIVTGSNNDTVTSGTGNDLIDTEAGEVVLNGGGDVDSWAANYTALATGVTVNLQTSAITGVGASTIIGIEALGYGFSNYFRTGSGNDVLTTRTGLTATYGDYIQTNLGNDTVLVGGGGDYIDLGVGGDDLLIVDYSAFANGIVTGGSFAGAGADWGGLYQVGGAGPDAVFFSNVARFDVRGASGGDTIRTGSNNDTIFGNGGNDTITSGAGSDLVLGGSGNDTVFGEAGNDSVYGGDNNDFMLGQEGSDYLDGQGENDALYGGDSNDTVVGNIGDDYLDGQGENDELYGNDGRDIMVGNLGNDYLDGGDGRDELYGNDNNDTLIGNLDNDYLDGQGESDILYGSQGNDTLFGNVGNDQLWGGVGTDSLIGGLGDDQFRFQLSDLQIGVRDVIADFAEAGGNADLLVFFGVSAGAVTTAAAGSGTLVSIAIAGGVAEILVQGFTPAQLADQIFFL